MIGLLKLFSVLEEFSVLANFLRQQAIALYTHCFEFWKLRMIWVEAIAELK